MKNKGFTLVELVIVIAIVIILSVVSVPIYRGYTKQAKMSEAYAILGVILSSQKAYYSQYGYFFFNGSECPYDPVLGIDVRGNKYCTLFFSGATNDSFGTKEEYFRAAAVLPEELYNGDKSKIHLFYNITSGYTFRNNYK